MTPCLAEMSLVAPQVDLLQLGRRGRRDELTQQAQVRRAQPGWGAVAALELACAWLLAGDPVQADLAYVEADLLDPSLALVPDVWGLWPPPAPSAAADHQRQAAQALAERYLSWRHPDPQALWSSVLPQLQADWHRALEPEITDPLLILGRATAGPGAIRLDPPLEPELVHLVADAEIIAEPAASNRYWQLVATVRPGWDLARIRAADLALARGELETSGGWLQDPPPEALANPWFHDVSARHAVQRGAVDLALTAWSDAIRAAQSMADSAAMVEVFEQRRREARRGPGVLQVRSLANRGETEAALALLERLLAEDPQWQPLRSLRDQLQTSRAPARHTSASPASASPKAPVPASPPPEPPSTTPDEASPPSPAPAAAMGSLEAFNHLLDRATADLAQLGQAVQGQAGVDPLDGDMARASLDPEAALQELDGLNRRLSDYEARFALA